MRSRGFGGWPDQEVEPSRRPRAAPTELPLSLMCAEETTL